MQTSVYIVLSPEMKWNGWLAIIILFRYLNQFSNECSKLIQNPNITHWMYDGFELNFTQNNKLVSEKNHSQAWSVQSFFSLRKAYVNIWIWYEMPHYAHLRTTKNYNNLQRKCSLPLNWTKIKTNLGLLGPISSHHIMLMKVRVAVGQKKI